MQDTLNITGLEPLIAPEEVGLWPLATGWFIISGLLLITLTLLVIFWLRRRNKNRYRALALKQLKEIVSGAEQHPARQDMQALNRLLKQTALHVFPRDQVASLYGNDWLDFLEHSCKRIKFSGQHRALFLYWTYKNEKQVDIPPDQWFQLVGELETWIKKHGKPKKNE